MRPVRVPGGLLGSSKNASATAAKAGECVCPTFGNGTVGEALMLAPVTKGGSYRYIVINETEPFCITSQAPGDCKKGMIQKVVPSCPPAPPSASSAVSVAAGSVISAAVAAVAAGLMVVA